MEDNTKESGLITIWKVWECILGLMVEDMKESIKMIKSTVMVFTFGQIKDNIKDIGLEESSME